MFLPEALQPLEHPNRVRIMALLYKRGDVETSSARTALNMTPGNLDSHGRKLEESDWIESRKVLTKSGFTHRLRLTRRGTKSFQEYLRFLREFLEATESK